MPKKFAGENTKATVARERKNAAQLEKQTKAAQAKEDAYWADDDKNVLRKQQRKEEEEKKRQQALQRKQELKAMHDEELNSISSSGKAKTTTPHKVTRAAIESNREAQEKLRLEEEERRRLEEKRIEPLAPEVEVNINQLDPDALNARNVEDAIKALTVEESSVDRHPEKRMKAAYTAFEDRNMPRLKEEHPTLRLSQLRQILKKMVNVTVFGTNEQEFPDVNVNQTIGELLDGLSLNGSDFGMIYYGRTLKRDQVISELPGLKPNHKLYIICQKAKVSETPVLLPTKAKEVAKECLYRLENLQPYEEEKLLSYIYDKNYKANLLKDFRPLINRDMSIMNALNDFSCIKASIGEENFVSEHPNFAVIVKSMLDKIVVSIPTTSWFANQPGNAVRRQAPAMNASPLITPEMLRNALNVALLPTPPVQPNQNVATSGGGNAANQTQRNYAAQLEQLREFGFSDDNENLIALEACDGNVDQALELIITMRENPSDA